MTNRLIELEETFPGRTRPLLVISLVVGDPFREATRDYMEALVEGGADAIELFLPFSDPVYHGPVMRRASRRAMSEKVGWDDLEEMIADFRDDDAQTPVFVSSYVNRILARGERQCARGLAEAGADGLMVTDLPAEEAGSVADEIRDQQMVLVQTVAPTTTDDRFRRLADDARGMLVWTGHSGAEPAVDESEYTTRIEQFRRLSELPIVASMNIESGPEAARIAEPAHGVLVGSAVAWLIEGKGPGVAERLESFVADLRLHLDGVED